MFLWIIQQGSCSLLRGRCRHAGRRGPWLSIWGGGSRIGKWEAKAFSLSTSPDTGTVPNTGALTLRPRSPANQEAEKPHEETREAKVQPNRVTRKQRNKQECHQAREKNSKRKIIPWRRMGWVVTKLSPQGQYTDRRPHARGQIWGPTSWQIEVFLYM